MQNAGLDEAYVGIKIARRKINNLRYNTTIMAESEEELKSFLIKMKMKVAQSCPTLATPWTIQSMEFSRPEYWNGSCSLIQDIFPTEGSNPGLLHCRQILYHLKVKGEWKSWLTTQHSRNKDHGIWSHHFMANRWGQNGNSDRLYFLGLQSHCRQWLQPWNSKRLAPWKERYDKTRQCIQNQRHHIANKQP